MIASCIITLVYVIKLQWFVETDYAFWRITAITALSEIGLWCFYYYARDYEGIKAHEENAKRIARHFTMMVQPSDEDDSGQKQ
ncbi:gp45 [Shigella virus Moo19]|uniref:Uncharacterized protein n=1 Tax=Shigella virus Moo19 TaxID=2886042 RepID=A0AAE9C680_9CAUD|nr:gp45 [Shigella virus Moo19]UEN68841.1 hypothetical protein Moo19_gp45 [Shigella virus Moo19]